MTAPAEDVPATLSAAERVRRPLSTSGWLIFLTMLVFGFGLVASRPPAPPDLGPPQGDVAAARKAIEALVHPGSSPAALALLPADFTAVTGVRPGALPAMDGTVRAVHVDGGCSTPWGDDNTKWDYSVPCKAHDLGYDLLRYSARKGHPLGPEIRTALDDRLSKDMHAACRLNPMNSAGTCEVVASLYSAGLVVNSWHQRWGPPVGDPLGPLLAGVAVIACLLMFRLRGWLNARRSAPVPRPAAEGGRPPASPVDRWAVLGVASIVLLMLGESAVALAHWAGAAQPWLWPFTWLAQLAPLFFFAGGHANAGGWREALADGEGYRHYLAHRASWLLRPALIFAVVALVVPLALELLGIPAGTNASVMQIALHPLWLLGVYLMTMIATPVMLALHRRAPGATVSGLLGLTVLGELTGSWLGSPLPRYAATLGVALLAQQLAFVHADGARPDRRTLLTASTSGLVGLGLASVLNGTPLTLLGSAGAPSALAAPAWSVLLLGLVQLSLLGLLAGPLDRVVQRPRVVRAVQFALRAPMSLYLGFLSAMLLLVAVVYLPAKLAHSPAKLAHSVDWLFRPRAVVALAMLAGPAALVFWWFERLRWLEPGRGGPVRQVGRPGRWSALLGRSATALGVGYATLGLFGFALTRFGGGNAEASILGLQLDPIQSLIHLLLGVFLLHTVRIGTSAATGTWLVCGLACVPPLMAVADGDTTGAVGLLLHGVTGAFALAATAGSLWQFRTLSRSAI
jgi:hypothetical protein